MEGNRAVSRDKSVRWEASFIVKEEAPQSLSQAGLLKFILRAPLINANYTWLHIAAAEKNNTIANSSISSRSRPSCCLWPKWHFHLYIKSVFQPSHVRLFFSFLSVTRSATFAWFPYLFINLCSLLFYDDNLFFKNWTVYSTTSSLSPSKCWGWSWKLSWKDISANMKRYFKRVLKLGPWTVCWAGILRFKKFTWMNSGL